MSGRSVYCRPQPAALVLILTSWCVLVALAAAAGSQAAELSGEVGYSFHYLTEAADNYKSSLTGQLVFQSSSSLGGFYIEAKGKFETQPNKTEKEWELGQAYLDIYLENIDIRAGNQTINWGTADGINPTSTINPQDLTSLTNMEPAWLPVPAVRASYYFDSGAALTGVVARHKAADLPANTQLAGIQPSEPKEAERYEIAVRGEMPLPGGPQVYLTYSNTWEDYPVMWLQPVQSFPYLMPMAKYRRQQAFGVATATTYSSGVAWIEAAYKIPEKLSELEMGTSPTSNLPLSGNDPYAQVVVGADYTFTGGLYTSAHFFYNGQGSLLNPYFSAPGQPEKAHTYLILNSRYTITEAPDSQIELMGLVDVNGKSSLLATRYSFQPLQNLKLFAGYVLAKGEQNDIMMVRPQLQGWLIGATYSF